jgi:hypothetical protein
MRPSVCHRPVDCTQEHRLAERRESLDICSQVSSAMHIMPSLGDSLPELTPAIRSFGWVWLMPKGKRAQQVLRRSVSTFLALRFNICMTSVRESTFFTPQLPFEQLMLKLTTI